MKRIFSIVLAISMIFAMMATVNAASTDSYMTFTASADEVTVGDTFTVTVKYVPGADSAFKGGTLKFLFDDTVATLNPEEVDAMADFSNNLVKADPDKDIYTIKHLAGASDDWESLTEEGVFSVIEFTAEKAGTFTLSADTASVTFAEAGNTNRFSYKGTNIAPITVTVKEPVTEPDPVAVEKVSAGYKNFTADEVEFTNLFVAEYKLTGKAADKFFKITKVVVNGTKAGEAASKEFAGFETEFGGEAEITFKAALSGVDAPDSMSFDITAEYVD